MLARLTATQFIRNMTSGKTAPLLCGCADQTGRHDGEFVVKFLSTKGALYELLCSRLATHFGILVPEPAAVQVEQEFADVVNERLRQVASSRRIGTGLNFGSRVVNPMTMWLVGRMIPEAMFQDATNIFAFDALIQNPDRRVTNANLFTQGGWAHLNSRVAYPFAGLFFAKGGHSRCWTSGAMRLWHRRNASSSNV